MFDLSKYGIRPYQLPPSRSDAQSRFPNLPWGERMDQDDMLAQRLKREAPRIEADIKRLRRIRNSLENQSADTTPLVDISKDIAHIARKNEVCNTCGGKDRCDRYGSPPQGCYNNFNAYYGRDRE